MSRLAYAQASFLGRAVIRFDAQVSASDLSWAPAFLQLLDLRLKVLETEANHLAVLLAYDRWEASGAPQNEADFEAWELVTERFFEASDVFDDAYTAWLTAWQYKRLSREEISYANASIAVGLGWEVES
jgi:hypothetical protein